MINRRFVLLGASTGAVALAGTGGATLRLNRTPRRSPKLTDAHLASLVETNLARPRALFVGNSLILGNDLPGLVARRASESGVALATATAAASGARLIETLRIAAFRRAVRRVKWDVVVLQDFTKTPLRRFDRWGSALAVDGIARLAPGAAVVLYPPFPAAAGASAYRSAGRLATTPKDPMDYARLTEAHYADIGDAAGYRVAPVPARWVEADNPEHYAADGLHPSAAGSAFVADILWSEIAAALSTRPAVPRDPVQKAET